MENLESGLKELVDLVGTTNCLQDKESLEFYSTDVFEAAKKEAIAIIRPNNADELIKVVRTCLKNEFPIVVRGGGASYTGGYLPVKDNTIIVDSSRLKKIEVNEEDMFVTVEPGVTWEELYESLKPKAIRTQYWEQL